MYTKENMEGENHSYGNRDDLEHLRGLQTIWGVFLLQKML